MDDWEKASIWMCSPLPLATCSTSGGREAVSIETVAKKLAMSRATF
jgi:hypothetical protein